MLGSTREVAARRVLRRGDLALRVELDEVRVARLVGERERQRCARERITTAPFPPMRRAAIKLQLPYDSLGR